MLCYTFLWDLSSADLTACLVLNLILLAVNVSVHVAFQNQSVSLRPWDQCHTVDSFSVDPIGSKTVGTSADTSASHQFDYVVQFRPALLRHLRP